MPYIKEKGVRDLYLIRVARIGNKAEIHPNSKDEEPRLVFELEYLESLPEYEPISLTRYWYKDTLLGKVFRSILWNSDRVDNHPLVEFYKFIAI